jgi:type I restriction enzyme S subunit
MSFPRYPKYKESGVEWLGKVPEHWAVRRLKNLVAEPLKYGANESAELDDQTFPRFVRITDIDEAGGLYEDTFKSLPTEVAEPYLLKEGDVLLARSGATVGKSFIYSTQWGTACFAGYLIRARLNSTHCSARWLYYFCQTDGYWAYVIGSQIQSTIQNVSAEKYANLYLPIPSIEDQVGIAEFLDRETAKIDALVAAQQRLIELLKEKRQAVISHVVTKGLNPNAPMKPSGIEWLGDVPAHWELKATKRLFRLVVEPAPDDNDHELLSIYTDIGVRPRKSLEAKGNKATTTDGYWMVKKGDLIVNKLLAWMGAIGISDYDGVTSPAYDILRQKLPLNPRFYDFLFRCGICFTEFRRFSRGIMDMRLRLYFDELGQLIMPFPPKSEQDEIVSFLEGKLARFDELSAEAMRAIDLLQERRTALISAAVTGQIDVRGFAGKEAA